MIQHALNFLLLSNFVCFNFCRLLICFKSNFFENKTGTPSLWLIIGSRWSDPFFVGPDLVPNYLKYLSAEDIRILSKHFYNTNDSLYTSNAYWSVFKTFGLNFKTLSINIFFKFKQIVIKKQSYKGMKKKQNKLRLIFSRREKNHFGFVTNAKSSPLNSTVDLTTLYVCYGRSFSPYL